MSSMKSQFVSNGGYGGKDYLLDSLSVIGADTRQGFDAATAEKITAMTNYVAADPAGANSRKFNEYVAKITPAATEAKPSAAPRATKPGSGLM